MSKAFLSHSSADKHFVSRVFAALGPARAHFDEATFDPLTRSFDSIVRSLKDSNLLVVFVSAESLESEWVQEELGLAVDKASVGRILQRAVVLLENIDRGRLPTSLRSATSVKHEDPDLVARRILGLLQDIEADATSATEYFLGRDEDNTRLKAAMLPIDGTPSPTALFLGGASGIGKRTLVTRALRDAFPYLPGKLRTVSLPEACGPIDLYMRVIDGGIRSIRQLQEAHDSFSALNLDAQVSGLADAFAEIAERRDATVLHGAEILLTEDGDLVPWASRVIDQLRTVGHPYVVFLSTRLLAPRFRLSRDKLHHQAIHSIDEPNSRRLLTSLLRDLAVPADSMAKLVHVTQGHPGQILRAAKLVRSDGGISAALRAQEIVDALSGSAAAMVRLLNLDDVAMAIVRLFGDFDRLSAEDVLAGLSSQAAQRSLGALVDQCVIEKIGNLYRIAPFLEASVRRYASARVDKALLISARHAIADRLKRFTADDLVEFDVLDQSVIAWLKSGEVLPPVPGAKLLLPASLLRAASAAYDGEDYKLCAELALRASEGEWTLTPEALGEAVRLRGLSLARLDEQDKLMDLIESARQNPRFLEVGQRAVNKMIAFMLGFNARLDGRYKDAIQSWQKYMALGGESNFKALREYADVLSREEKFEDAEKWARKALAIAPNNPYVLSILQDILRARVDAGDRAAREEYETSLASLEAADAMSGTSFALVQRARGKVRDGQYGEAMKLLAQAHGRQGVDIYSLRLDKADAMLRANQASRALVEVEEAMVAANRSLKKRARRLRPQAARIKVQALCELGRVGEAEDTLKSDGQYLPDLSRGEMRKLVDFARARQSAERQGA